MGISDRIKQNRFLRGFHMLYSTYFGNCKRSRFGYLADTAKLIPPLKIDGPQNIYMYENTKVENSTISAVLSKFIMKKGSAAAEGLSVHTGNHMQLVGKYYRSITRQDKINSGKVFDKDVVVEEDVWIGCNVTLLSGAHLGRSSVIAAGAVVNSDIPPYCIVGGVPAKPIKFKWTIDQILEHEAILYPESERFSREELEKIFAETKTKAK